MMIEKDPSSEEARDMLGRQDLYMATQWYVFTHLHKRVDVDDERVGVGQYVTDEEAV